MSLTWDRFFEDFMRQDERRTEEKGDFFELVEGVMVYQL
jgi:hypothetical protein